MKAASRKIQEVDITELYEAAGTYATEDLRRKVTEYIENARVPNHSILRAIPSMSKRQLLQVITDFYLKGCGLGVK